jgi:hypothetical protein
MYDTKASSTYHENTTDEISQAYGRGEVKGYGASDVFCFEKGESCTDLKMMSIYSAVGTPDLARNGLFGLSRLSMMPTVPAFIE